MGSGPDWDKGNKNQYLQVEEIFNGATSKQLKDFADELAQQGAASVMEVQSKHLHDRHPNYDWETVAKGWYGFDNSPLIWSNTSTNRPAEIEKILRESRRWLADLLAASDDRKSSWFTQCYHDDFEVRLTWPRSGLTPDSEIRVWVFVPYNMSRGGTNSGDKEIKAAIKDLATKENLAFEGFREASGDQSALPNEINDAEALHRTAATSLDEQLDRAARSLLSGTAFFRDTPRAMGGDAGLPLIGALEVTSLDDSPSGPREHRLDQPPGERNNPQGPPAAGVRFRWNRQP